ncbi:bifunctional 5,10-methylenetetrahydrofolate dehydrogenase/5,10-methenyltetrahydrofolate cyclohydrolase [Fructilactobacillus frigidiflavus]|uniref:bifunctional 5,10-methylenetetrahydrofolate dehydrogenase/5,10-methenyltetrahydrofolate cyclohydrolase n=1 Tax=Fructilactobacillus frigidiflavus TaxID=3242688 RepID=UPI003757F08D
MVEMIDGRKVAKQLNETTKQKVLELAKQGTTPGLAVILVGNNQASQRYVHMKEKKALELGINSIMKTFPTDVSEATLINTIKELNQNPTVNGILVQAPLPDHIDEQKVIETILPEKDVDGFHPTNVGNLFLNLDKKYPVACTPKGVMTLLEKYNVDLDGANVVIVGRSSIVGKPMLALMLNANATVTDVHSHTKNLKAYTRAADVVISAVGKANFLTDDDFKPGAYVIDVGQNLDENGRLVGDVNYHAETSKIGYITPVPGGVGPMTIATLMQQTVEMCEWSL